MKKGASFHPLPEKQWSLLRHRYPCESLESKIELDFNFWIANRYVSNENTIDLLESFLFGKKPLSVQSEVQPSSVVCLFLQDFDPNLFTNSSQDLQFLAKCTSVPMVSAKIDFAKESNPANTTNPWFWNDVKTIPSFLLWPRIGTNLFQQMGSFPAFQFFTQYQLTVLVTISLFFLLLN
jgi:hypothetical protein